MEFDQTIQEVKNNINELNKLQNNNESSEKFNSGIVFSKKKFAPLLKDQNIINNINLEINKYICTILSNLEDEISNINLDITEKVILRIASMEETIKSISKSTERIDGDEVTIKLLSEKLDSLERNICDLQHNEIEMENTIKEYRELGFTNTKLNMLNKRSTSQAGEDCILAYIIAVLGIPFNECSYIDLGANHPIEMNNTYFFYTQGAKGILVEANPELIPELASCRKRDVVLNRCIDTISNKMIEFNIMNIDGLSTPDAISAEKIVEINKNAKIEEKVSVKTITVNDIVRDYLNNESPIILSIDVEGKDMEILKSIDFKKIRPVIIIIEMIEYSTKLVVGKKNNNILEFMALQNYSEFAFTGINSIFIDNQRIN